MEFQGVADEGRGEGCWCVYPARRNDLRPVVLNPIPTLLNLVKKARAIHPQLPPELWHEIIWINKRACDQKRRAWFEASQAICKVRLNVFAPWATADPLGGIYGTLVVTYVSIHYPMRNEEVLSTVRSAVFKHIDKDCVVYTTAFRLTALGVNRTVILK